MGYGRIVDASSTSQNVSLVEHYNLIIIITFYLTERNNIGIDHVNKPMPKGLDAIAPVPFNEVKLAVKRYYRANPEELEDLIDLTIAGE